jgi:putative nucleotidyltransferase with HDIG domain
MRVETNDIPRGAAAPFAVPAPAKLRLLRRNCELPPIPSVAMSLLGLLAKEHVALAEISDTIAADAAITAEVLRGANSAYYGVRGEVTSIQHAATLLGLDRIRGLAATIGLRRLLGPVLRTPAVLRCWRHNLACAVTSEQMATRLGGHTADAYTAGLLHDIGRLALVVGHPKSYPEFLDTATAAGAALLDEERTRFGMDHCEAGEWFAQQLILPQAFQDVARHHHNPAAVGPTDLLGRVGVACALADRLGYWVVAPPLDADFSTLDSLEAALLPLPIAQRITLAAEFADLAVEVHEQVHALDGLVDA